VWYPERGPSENILRRVVPRARLIYNGERFHDERDLSRWTVRTHVRMISPWRTDKRLKNRGLVSRRARARPGPDRPPESNSARRGGRSDNTVVCGRQVRRAM